MIQIGADPELFFKKGNKFISAIGKIGGTKEKPRRLLGKFALQEDNVAVEYNIPACTSTDKFVWANQVMLEEIQEIAEKNNCEIAQVSSAVFDDDELNTPAARMFGCDPDFNAWELTPNPRPEAKNPNLRSAGGHIHIGISIPAKEKLMLVRALDLMVGSVLCHLDPTSERRELYGKAGACRLKPYGVEYRTPSNVWLFDETLMRYTAQSVWSVTHHRERFISYAKELETYTQAAINDLSKAAIEAISPALSDIWPSGILTKIKKQKEKQAKTAKSPYEKAVNPIF